MSAVLQSMLLFLVHAGVGPTCALGNVESALAVLAQGRLLPSVLGTSSEEGLARTVMLAVLLLLVASLICLGVLLRRHRRALAGAQQNILMQSQVVENWAALAESRDQVALLVDEEGRVVIGNSAAMSWLGNEEREVEGELLAALLPEKEALSVQDQLEHCIAHKAHTHARVTRGGHCFQRVMSPTSVQGKGAQLVRVFEYDITDLVELEADLIRVQKLDAERRMAGGIAHDFNNMLQAITGYADLARRELNSSGKVDDMLHNVLKASKRAEVLVRKLLEFSHKELATCDPIDVGETIKTLIESLRDVVPSNVEVVVDVSPDARPILGDRRDFGEVVWELCLNARDVLEGDGGRITLRVSPEYIDEALGDLKPGEYTAISVEDNGPGIPESEHSLIFEPFYSTKRHSHDTGMGLATVSALVSRNSGSVGLFSREKEGARFKVLWPAAPEGCLIPKPASPLELGESARRKVTLPKKTAIPVKKKRTRSDKGATVLLAEDEEMLRNLAKHTLERGGFQVIAAKDGLDGLDLYKQNRGSIDILVLDVVMPRMNGRELYDQVYEMDPGMPVVFCSGYSGDMLQQDYMLNVGAAILRKPYHRDQLLSAVAKQLANGN